MYEVNSVTHTMAATMAWCHRTLSWGWIRIGRMYGWIWAGSWWHCLVTTMVWMFEVVPHMSLLQDWTVRWCCAVTATITQQLIHQKWQVTCCGAVLWQDIVCWSSLRMMVMQLFRSHMFQHLVHLYQRKSSVKGLSFKRPKYRPNNLSYWPAGSRNWEFSTVNTKRTFT